MKTQVLDWTLSVNYTNAHFKSEELLVSVDYGRCYGSRIARPRDGPARCTVSAWPQRGREGGGVSRYT